MGGGGGKGGSQTTETQLTPSLQAGADGILASAMNAASLDYQPNRGVSIAAFDPQQKAAFDGANQAASAFGLPSVQSPSGGPVATDMGGGIMGHSTAQAYDQMVDSSLSPQFLKDRQAVLNQYKNTGSKVARLAGKSPSSGGGGK